MDTDGQTRDSIEFREKRSAIVSKLVNRFSDDGEHSLRTQESRLARFDALGSHGFIELVSGVNQVLTQEPSEGDLSEIYHVIVDESNIGSMQLMPAPEDRERFLKKLYMYTKRIPRDLSFADEQVAAFVGFGINAIHPFSEGNGRTARTIYTLLTANDANRENLLMSSASNQNEGIYYLNPATFREPLYRTLQIQSGTHQEQNGAYVPLVKPVVSSSASFGEIPTDNREPSEEDIALVEAIFRDDYLPELLVGMLAKRKDMNSVNQALQMYGGKPAFDITTFIRLSTKEDFATLRSFYKQTSRQYIDMLFESMVGNSVAGEYAVLPTYEYGTAAIKMPAAVRHLAKRSININRDGFATMPEDLATDNIAYLG